MDDAENEATDNWEGGTHNAPLLDELGDGFLLLDKDYMLIQLLQ